MSATSIWALIATGELALLLGLALAVGVFRARAARRRDQQAIENLVARVKQNCAERDRAMRVFLADRFGLADEALDAAAVPLLQEELRLYETFANLYLRRDADAAAAFDQALQRAVSSYWQLSAQATASIGLDVDGNETELAQVELLREQNQLLSEELQIAMGTMTRMLQEYSGMFANPDADRGQASPAATGPAGDSSATPPAVADAGVHPDAPQPHAEPPLSDEAADALLADALGEVDLEIDEAQDGPGGSAPPESGDRGQKAAG